MNTSMYSCRASLMLILSLGLNLTPSTIMTLSNDCPLVFILWDFSVSFMSWCTSSIICAFILINILVDVINLKYYCFMKEYAKIYTLCLPYAASVVEKSYKVVGFHSHVEYLRYVSNNAKLSKTSDLEKLRKNIGYVLFVNFGFDSVSLDLILDDILKNLLKR